MHKTHVNDLTTEIDHRNHRTKRNCNTEMWREGNKV